MNLKYKTSRAMREVLYFNARPPTPLCIYKNADHFKLDSCKTFATNLNAANSLGLGSKMCSKHFTLNNRYRFFIIFFCKY